MFRSVGNVVHDAIGLVLDRACTNDKSARARREKTPKEGRTRRETILGSAELLLQHYTEHDALDGCLSSVCQKAPRLLLDLLIIVQPRALVDDQ